ncbi:MAG TPA: nucleotide-binding protein [Lacipirellulaceae bacterium]|nr:nucleotide-binding protein [Lacipirellulaceae bacterium]
MAKPSYAGYWTGKFEGTNQGGVTIDIKEDGGVLSGLARFSEPALGQYEYALSGNAAEQLSLKLTPSRAQAHINLGTLQILGALNADGSLSGRWKSTIGTEGVFTVHRQESSVKPAPLPKKNSVFLVHGHDEGAKHGVARFLEQLGIAPVILQEQINRGMTVIEKFEDFANRAGFAVVIMSPDDYGYAVGSEQEKKHRPRQNVVLELGYFAAKLGRDKTFVLTKGDVEMPSDVLGLVYEPMDRSEGWKVKLARELKAAGFEIDMNRAIG